MAKIEIDGREYQVADGSSIIDAAERAGIYIPRFCYHKKLSVAANCRMCLVQVEKLAKPVPACATPVTDGMKIHTRSEATLNAQKAVMEFLLINHPLDCPICDQGGECELQDLAVGYGGVKSRYAEEKRVVVNKDIGPLVSTDMTRCIHCTRCVRFGQEIAGIMEMGQIRRGEHSEIMPFVSRSVDSELSGNMIDLCPVGALTSKPFRYTARPWELQKKAGISPHDGFGSNLEIHVRQNRVYRVVARDNESVNECWISDRDRFSYEGLNAADRLVRPMVKKDGQWQEVDWQYALEHAASGLKVIRDHDGAGAMAALLSPGSTVEEMYLAKKVMAGLGCGNVDHRLRQGDFSLDGNQQGASWLGMTIAELSQLKSILLVGSTVRKEQPLVALKLRQALKQGAQLNIIHTADDNLLVKVANKSIVAPGALVNALAQVLKAAVELKQGSTSVNLDGVNVGEAARKMAENLAGADKGAVLLGHVAQHHPHYGDLHVLAAEIARITGATLGVLSEGANSVGGQLVGAQSAGGEAVLAKPRKAYLLLNVEPEYDCANSAQALSTLKQADVVVALASYKGQAMDYATVLLPVAAFAENSGTYVSMEGRVQGFVAAVKPQGEARPAWKVLRVLGNLLGMGGFDYETCEQVRDEALAGDVAGKLSNQPARVTVGSVMPLVNGLQRLGEVPLYATDAIVRRSPSLQKTADAQAPRAFMHGSLLARLGVKEGDMVVVKQGSGVARLPAARCDKLPEDCVRVAAARAETQALGELLGEISVERA